MRHTSAYCQSDCGGACLVAGALRCSEGRCWGFVSARRGFNREWGYAQESALPCLDISSHESKCNALYLVALYPSRTTEKDSTGDCYQKSLHHSSKNKQALTMMSTEPLSLNKAVIKGCRCMKNTGQGSLNPAIAKLKKYHIFHTVNHARVLWDSKTKPKGLLGGHLNICNLVSMSNQINLEKTGQF